MAVKIYFKYKPSWQAADSLKDIFEKYLVPHNHVKYEGVSGRNRIH